MAKTNVESEIRACVDSFVTDLTNIVQQATLEQVLEAVSDAIGGAPKRRGPGRPRKTAAAPRAAKSGKRLRRSSANVDKVTEAALAHVTANPGCSVSEIGAALGTTTKDLRLPLQKLLGEGKVKTVGQKRGTRYHPGGRRPAAVKKKATKKKASRKKKG